MLLTITTTHQPASDLGYLLYKNPARLQSFSLAFGQAHIFYPEANADRCTAALLLEIDPIGLVRNRRALSGGSFSLEPYVNDRPYVASSFLSVAIAQVFGTAMSGTSRERQELADTQLPFEARIAVLPCRGGDLFLRKLFEPLGYAVHADRIILDDRFPEWGESRYYSVRLEARVRLRDLLRHLYVLMPVLDDEKHYWVGDDEVDKLLRHASEWLGSHPEKEQIADRYLKHRKHLVRDAMARLVEEDDPDPDTTLEERTNEETELEERISLNEHRIGAVLAAVRNSNPRRVLDLGCGSGKLLERLLHENSIERIVGLDVSYRVLEVAKDRLRLERLPENQKSRIQLMQGSLTYRDRRLEGFDCATAVEVIEHLDPDRLAAFERVVFAFAKPQTLVITTPNTEYNIKFDNLPAGKLRHKDHRFEWTRLEFESWAKRNAEKYGYSVRFLAIGPAYPELGAPTQMGVFQR